MTDTAACVLAHIALHKQLHTSLTDAIPAVVAALCKEIDTEEQLCDGDVTCEYVCQPAVEFLAHMASQSANLIDIGLANGIEALARAVAVEPGKQRVTERSILALNLIASGGPSFSNAVARWRNVTNFRNQIGKPATMLPSDQEVVLLYSASQGSIREKVHRPPNATNALGALKAVQQLALRLPACLGRQDSSQCRTGMDILGRCVNMLGATCCTVIFGIAQQHYAQLICSRPFLALVYRLSAFSTASSVPVLSSLAADFYCSATFWD